MDKTPIAFKIESKFQPSPDQQKAIDQIVENINNNKDRQVLLGVTGSGKTYVMAKVIEKLNRPSMILSHNKTLAAQLFEEFKEFFPTNAVKYFVSYYDYYQPEAYIPGKDIYIEKESDINEQIERFRLSAMNAAVTRKDTIVVASVSCIYNIGNPANYRERSFEVKLGDKINISELSRNLVLMQYKRDATDFVPGTFRIKGDIIDIFIPYDDFPIRINLWGDEVEGLAYIDGLTAHKLADLKQVEVFPCRSFVYDFDAIKTATQRIEADLEKRLEVLKAANKILEAQRLDQRTKYDIEMLREIGYCKAMENYSIYFENRSSGEPPYSLLDYFPKDYLLFIDESHITIPQVGGMFNGDKARKETLIDYGFRLPSAKDNRPLNFEEFRERQGKTVYVSATPNKWELEDSKDLIVELLTRPTGLLDPIIDVRPTEHQIDDVINEVQKVIAKGQRTIITTLTKKMSEDLSAYLIDLGIKSYYLHSDIDTVERVDILRDLRLGKYDVLVGINLLREGIDLPEVSLVLILDADKEGFLRSRTSLVQTMGRAARHVEGRVILYADRITDSMDYAIKETRRRRKYQEEYNRQNGITPTTIVKGIRDKLVDKPDNSKEQDYEKWARENKPPASQVRKLIKDLEDRMFIASSNMQFEKAAELRDEIKGLKELLNS